MASSEQLKALLRSHLEGDDDRFFSIALQMAAHEARIGHGKLAVELRDIVEKAKKQAKSTAPVSIAKGLKDSSGLLYATTPQVKLGELVTTDEVNEKLTPRHSGTASPWQNQESWTCATSPALACWTTWNRKNVYRLCTSW